ncbi:hypothetical protein [Alcaligenes faecalis]|uniref:hypothetical protein n=1 Tax=Alcaligenes faecalis TaxID=511 RepID=UPI00214FE318|nr:hypothetical protein [Alcaligenes faecalis]MCR4144894.1 hypothetical protein [Alcaligenes faecalis]
MRHEYMQGWFKLRPIIGWKWEITYFDGLLCWCEDVRFYGGYASAVAYCKERINAARSR